MNYRNGKIYKIISQSTDKIYIGSTCTELSKRLHQHKLNFKNYLDGKSNYMSSFEIIKYGDAKIILIVNYPCLNKEHLTARENYFIETTTNNINHQLAPLTADELYWKTRNITLTPLNPNKRCTRRPTEMSVHKKNMELVFREIRMKRI